jgi:flagellar protein FliS
MVSSQQASALRHYRSSGSAAATCDASQHQMILMLYNGAIESLGRAQAAMASNDMLTKNKSVRSTLDIIGYLRGILKPEAGGTVANNLSMLYEYMVGRLSRANVMNDPEGVREVSKLIAEIKAGWEAIPQDKRY